MMENGHFNGAEYTFTKLDEQKMVYIKDCYRNSDNLATKEQAEDQFLYVKV
jgi:hypothetical protein